MASDAPPLADTHLAGGGAFAPGTLVLGERFRVERLLGGGGMGLVYVAEQVSLGRKVALKVLRDDLLSIDGMGERFRREALLLSSVEHPAVVRVIDFGQHGQSMCLVMEYVEGPSLQQLLDREAPLSLERSERILGQLAQGLAAIHAKGIVHRDLKPDNVVMTTTPDGREQARVLDFGIARLAEPDQRQQVTQTGFVVGTPEYMSPEQAMGQSLDARSDLYTLGLIAFRMLSGKVPFPGPSPRELVSQQIHQAPPSLVALSPTLAAAPALVHLVTACLEKNPDARPPTAQAFLERLAQKPIPLTATVSGAARIAAAPTRLIEQARAVPRWKLALVSVLALAAFVSFVVWFTRPERVARRLLDARRGSEALQVIDDAAEGEKLSDTLKQLRAAALQQVGRGEEARKLLETVAGDAALEDAALEALADQFGQAEGRQEGARLRKLLASWPKAKVLPVMQRLAKSEEGWTQWGALRFVDVEYAGQGLNLAGLYLATLGAKDCGRRALAAKRLGELRSPEAMEALTTLKNTPRKKGGVLGLDEEDCGQSAAAAALRRIERDQGP